MAAATDQPPASSPRVLAYRRRSHGERSDAIAQLAALLAATTAELLDVVTAADAEEDWARDGATGMAPSLVALCHVSSATAREWVRTGKALDQLPRLRDAFASGALSWDQVRPASTYVTPSTDEVMAEALPGCTAAQIEARARQHRTVTRREAQASAAQRRFGWRTDHASGGFRYSGFLPADEGAIVNAALERHAETAGPDAETGVWEPFPTRCAGALVDLARQTLCDDPGPDPTLAVVHVDADVVDGLRDGNGSIDGLQVNAHTVLRLLCDTKIEYSVDGPAGRCVGVGRAGRTIPRWLRRRIVHRDVTCRFPGCERPIRHIHHIVHWSQGGATDSWNLAGKCWSHHHLVHEGGWRITGDADGELTFTSPCGRALSSSPARLRPEVRGRVAEAAGVQLHEPPPEPEVEPDDEGERAAAGGVAAADVAPPCRRYGRTQRGRAP